MFGSLNLWSSLSKIKWILYNTDFLPCGLLFSPSQHISWHWVSLKSPTALCYRGQDPGGGSIQGWASFFLCWLDVSRLSQFPLWSHMMSPDRQNVILWWNLTLLWRASAQNQPSWTKRHGWAVSAVSVRRFPTVLRIKSGYRLSLSQSMIIGHIHRIIKASYLN